MQKTSRMFIYALPVLLMIGLIRLIPNEYALTLVYAIIIALAFRIKSSRREIHIFAFGIAVMTFFEYLFVSMGVETFTQQSLLGVMPLWLPVLWGYSFVAIKRAFGLL